jgi:DNA-directed RNA polymerase specialized sigma24 family protein
MIRAMLSRTCEGGTMHRYTPREVAQILRSARSDPHSAALQEVLAEFQTRWRCFARRRWPWLQEHHDEAINTALQRLCDRIDELEDEERVVRWADLQFTRVMDGVKKGHKRASRRRVDVSTPEDDDAGDPFDRFPSPAHNTEDEAHFRERLRIVQSVVQLFRESYLRLIEGLPVEEVARLTGRTPVWIRTFTMRLRRALKEYLDDNDEGGPRRSLEDIFGKSGLPKDVVAKILELLRKTGGEP